MFSITWHGERHELVSGSLILIGRGDSCDLRLDDPSASRVHCRLLARDGKVYLTDAGSRWGTLVNGVRVNECELVAGDQITIGETVLGLTVEGHADDRTIARHSEVVRPPGLTLAPTAPFNVTPTAKTVDPFQPVRDEAASAEPIAASIGGLALRSPAAYVSTRIAGVEIHEFICRNRRGLLFRGSREEQPVAVKLLEPKHLQDEAARARFLRAVDVTRGLTHARLVTLLDGGIQDGIPFSVSEFIDGESVAQLIHRIGVAGMLDWRKTLQIAIDVATALEYLERQGVLHRNISPQHILIRAEDGCASLNDLLLAKALNEVQPGLTQAGEVVGELAFVSPEQLGSGQAVDHRSDLYQLGATLYALLTGRPPFEESNAANVINAVLRDQPTLPTRYHLSIPALFEGTVMMLLAKRPQDRFPSAKALSSALQRVQRYSG